MTAFTSYSSSTIHTQAAQPSSQEEEKRRNSSNSLGETKAEILTTSLHTDPTVTLATGPLVDATNHDKKKEELEMKGLGNTIESKTITSGSSPITATPRPKPGFWKQHLSI